ncbi:MULTISPECIES: transcriptional repressor XylR [Bacillus amyloliquefaciens group]|uniref:transcriptional repressor XylR n=1 Tax=Bacillus amyloliquefaciens group TaxID=1938374 RepID=UPI0007AA751F|nr:MULTISPECIES: xylose repressor [Bacillus amyloliquefaciens group]KZE56892.1 XylR family transcriptional regulator [Bacillus amyloliquefaciens]MCQ9148593.1 ROK family protein [Bacillus amyloliquefaciens]WOH98172.1 xylose repressor [Bacillus amyloliquefaciens]WOI50878.1 xylose repressor [Bacillus amyloliquefaciens]WOI65871.1 xylose repressor [Bacillus amyloliquefaciens]
MDIADQAFVKKVNQKLLLNEILKNAPISRAKLSEMTGLNKSTVSSQVNTLMKENLVFEIGQGQSSGGRRPVMLVFNRKAGYSVGIDVGVDYVNGILTDLEGTIVLDQHHHLECSSPEITKDILIEMILHFIANMPQSPYGLIGIGICVPGLIDKNQKIVFAPNSNWRDIDLKSFIQKKFNVPVFIENEANAGAYGEKVFGAAKNHDNMIYASIGTGIGIGVIINNDLYRGVSGFSGEMGHMTIDFNGPKCSCGNRGCWELYASEKALLTSLQTKEKKVSTQDIIDLAHLNDIGTLHALQNFGFYLGIGLTNILNTFNPQAIILRNSIIESHPIVLHSIKSEVSSRVYSHLDNSYELLPSILGKNAPALGMSSIVIDHFLDMVHN